MDCGDTVVVGYELVDGVLKDTTTINDSDKALNDLKSKTIESVSI